MRPLANPSESSCVRWPWAESTVACRVDEEAGRELEQRQREPQSGMENSKIINRCSPDTSPESTKFKASSESSWSHLSTRSTFDVATTTQLLAFLMLLPRGAEGAEEARRRQARLAKRCDESPSVGRQKT